MYQLISYQWTNRSGKNIISNCVFEGNVAEWLNIIRMGYPDENYVFLNSARITKEEYMILEEIL